MIGQTIYHSKYGAGIIQETRRNCFELKIEFEDTGQVRWVRRDDAHLQMQQFKQSIEKTKKIDIVPLVLRPDMPVSKSRRIIEALRVGLIPDDCVDDLTFGREQEITIIRQWLTSNHDNALLLVGNYGVGKTHLLNYTRAFALQNQYAVAFVEMDSDETPLHKPKRVYGQLVQNLRLRFSPDGSTEDFKILIKKAEHLLKDHPYFRYVFDLKFDGEKHEAIWQWIEAKEAAMKPPEKYFKELPSLYNYNVAGNLYCYLLSTLGWTVKQLGLKNLVLIFDEAEIIHSATTTYRKQGINFLNALLATAENNPLMRQVPSQLNYDYAISLAHLPFLYKETSELKILLAFTDENDLNLSFDLRKLVLESLSSSSIKKVLKEITILYEQAYHISLPETKIKHIYDHLNVKQNNDNSATRLWVKSYVEALDLIRFYPNEKLSDLLQ